MKKTTEVVLLDNRKTRIMLASAIYRAGILGGGMSIVHCLHGKSLLRRTLEQVIHYTETKLDTALTQDGGYSMLMSFATTLLAWIPRKKIFKLAIGAGVVTVIAIVIAKHHRER